MRENRPYGSEGGEAKSLPYPYRSQLQSYKINRLKSAFLARSPTCFCT